MKLNKLFFVGAALAVTLASCDKDNNGAGGANGKATTFAALNISTPGLRADAGQVDETGTEAESKLASVNLLSSVADQTWALGAADQPGMFWANGTDGYKVAPWKTQAGSQTMALMLNGTVSTFTGLSAATAPDFVYGGTDGQAEAELSALSTDNTFIMTSKVEAKTIADGKTADVVKAGADETSNVFKFDAERVVAKGIVKQDAALKADTKDGKGSINLSTLKYAPVNGAAKTYLFANNAGDRQMTSQKYGTFKSAIHSATAAATAAEAKTQGLIRLSNIASAATQNGVYSAQQVQASTSTAQTKGFYLMENSVVDLAAVKTTGFYRLAYAKVYAKFTPKKFLKLDGAKLVESTSAADLTNDGTFYKGQTDGLLYASKEAAKASLTAPNQGVYVYKNGMCGYRVLWNRISTDGGKTVAYADVRRNNIYMLNIKEFAGLGMPWDSSDIQDPNLPKDASDDSTVNPDDPNVEKQDTYMRVEAKVLPWNVVSRDVILERARR